MPSVFVSYSHKDQDALGQLRRHFAPLERERLVTWWDDTRIPPAEEWQPAIEKALAEASVAVLLITADFLASDFIVRHELPRILERHVRGELHVLPVFLAPSVVDFDELAFTVPGRAQPLKLTGLQGFGTPDKPLSDWTESEREREYVRLARHVTSLAAAGQSLPSGEPEPAPAGLLPASAGAPPGPRTTPGEAARRVYELVIRVTRRGDDVELTYERPGTPLPVRPQRTRLGPVAEIAQLLDVARLDVLQKRLAAATSDWGPALFALLFPDPRPVLDAVYERRDPPPTPAHGAVRVWIVTHDPLLVGLPWRLATWDGRLLVDLHWTLAVTRNPHPARHVSTRQPETLLVVAPPASPHEADVAPAVREVFEHLWGGGRAYVARTRRELTNALDGGLSPHVVFIRGHVADRAGRASLRLGDGSGGDALPIGELARLLKGHAPQPTPGVIYLDVTCDESDSRAFEPLLDVAPLVVWRRLAQPLADSTSRALVWLRRWLSDALDPLSAWRDAHWEDLTSSLEAASVVFHADYRTWTTQPPVAPPQPPAVKLVLDRRTPKGLVSADVREFVRSDVRRVLAFVACATPGHSIAEFGKQMEHYLQGDLGQLAAIRRAQLQIPDARNALFETLERELRLQLQADPGETLASLLRRHAPRRIGPARPVLWLDWGAHGEALRAPLTTNQLTEWVRFGAEFLAPQCPTDLRVISSVGLELGGDAGCAKVRDWLTKLRLQPWYEHQRGAFRLSELDPLGTVTQTEIFEFLTTHSTCSSGLCPELAELVFAESEGHFDRTVALLEEGQNGSWYSLAARLRGGSGAAGAAAGLDEELK